MKPPDRFRSLAIGMKPEEVLDLAGGPERREITIDGESWFYAAGDVEIAFGSGDRPLVSKIVFRAKHPSG